MAPMALSPFSRGGGVAADETTKKSDKATPTSNGPAAANLSFGGEAEI